MATRKLMSLVNSGCPHERKPEIDTSWSEPNSSKNEVLSDSAILSEIQSWMGNKLPCVAGGREYKRGRYFIRVATKESVLTIFEEYKKALEAKTAVACLFVFNEDKHRHGKSDVAGAFSFLADQMQSISRLPAHELARGAPLTNSLELVCPVTGLLTHFDDFECIAFCPQSNDVDDPLYDPLLAMPYPCVNMSSDVFAFSRFVADGVEQVLGHPAYEETDLVKLEKLLTFCVSRWQRVATTTINRYEDLTDTSLCPIHVTADDRYWVAGHKDPAFAEIIKETHSHELPILYGTRIVQNWMAHFHGRTEYSAAGLARDGLLVEEKVKAVG